MIAARQGTHVTIGGVIFAVADEHVDPLTGHLIYRLESAYPVEGATA